MPAKPFQCLHDSCSIHVPGGSHPGGNACREIRRGDTVVISRCYQQPGLLAERVQTRCQCSLQTRHSVRINKTQGRRGMASAKNFLRRDIHRAARCKAGSSLFEGGAPFEICDTASSNVFSLVDFMAWQT
jgi:hypothetical protein